MERNRISSLQSHYYYWSLTFFASPSSNFRKFLRLRRQGGIDRLTKYCGRPCSHHQRNPRPCIGDGVVSQHGDRQTGCSGLSSAASVDDWAAAARFQRLRAATARSAAATERLTVAGARPPPPPSAAAGTAAGPRAVAAAAGRLAMTLTTAYSMSDAKTKTRQTIIQTSTSTGPEVVGHRQRGRMDRYISWSVVLSRKETCRDVESGDIRTRLLV